MKLITKYLTGLSLVLGATTSQAMSIWVVESGQDPFTNTQGTLTLSSGINTLDLYYDVEGDTSYGYDFILDTMGTGSISNVNGGDSDLGDVFGSGWRQFGGDLYGETGSSVLGFTFDFTTDEGVAASLLVGGTYTDGNFTDASISPTLLVSAVPVPAAVWLFGSGLIGLAGLSKRKMS